MSGDLTVDERLGLFVRWARANTDEVVGHPGVARNVLAAYGLVVHHVERLVATCSTCGAVWDIDRDPPGCTCADGECWLLNGVAEGA